MVLNNLQIQKPVVEDMIDVYVNIRGGGIVRSWLFRNPDLEEPYVLSVYRIAAGRHSGSEKNSFRPLFTTPSEKALKRFLKAFNKEQQRQ